MNRIEFFNKNFLIIFFSSYNLKGKFFIIFLHASFFVLPIYVFISLSILVAEFNICTQKHSNLCHVIPTPRSGSLEKTCVHSYLSGTKSR
jgi:hypothetical protein